MDGEQTVKLFSFDHQLVQGPLISGGVSFRHFLMVATGQTLVKCGVSDSDSSTEENLVLYYLLFITTTHDNTYLAYDMCQIN